MNDTDTLRDELLDELQVTEYALERHEAATVTHLDNWTNKREALLERIAEIRGLLAGLGGVR